MSSGVATKPTLSSFPPFSKISSCFSLECPSLSHSSVLTRPGTTVFTRIFLSVSSSASALVRVITPPLSAPPMVAPFLGRRAAPPDVSVREPPGLTISYFARATHLVSQRRQEKRILSRLRRLLNAAIAR